MPSVLTHFAFLDKVYESADVAAKTSIEQNWNAAYWGSVGPDYLFFAPKDWTGGLGKFMTFIYDAQNDLEEVVRAFEDVSKFAGGAQEFLSGGLHSQMQLTAQSLQTTLLTHIAAATTDKFDMFSLVVSPTQEYEPIPNWWWMDVAHNLRTARHSANLWKNSQGDPMARAYTYGYLTHVSGDVVGHPYVNLISGGPYRLHPRRHVLTEKSFDSYLLKKWYGQDVSDCHWHEKILFGDDDVFPNLPENIISLIHKSLSDTYGDLGIKSGIPQPDEINQMYRNFHRMLKGSTALGVLNLPKPQFSMLEMPREIRDVFSDSPPSIYFPKDLSSESDWYNFLKSIFNFLKYCVSTLIKLLAVAYSVVAQLLTAPFRYFLWLIQRLLHEIFLNAQLALALGGFLHPTDRHLHYFKSLNNPPISQYIELANRFPFEKISNSDQTYHLVFPSDVGAQSETPAAFPFSKYWGPLNGVASSTPFFDVEGPLLGDAPIAGEDLMSICSHASPADITDFIQSNLGFRSARTLSLQLFGEYELNGGSRVPNFNLDGDRGFGWPMWKHTKAKPWDDTTFAFDC